MGTEKGRAGSQLACVYSSVLWELEYLQFSGWISSRCPLELCWSSQSSFCATRPHGAGGRCRARCDASPSASCSPVSIVCTVTLGEPWEQGTAKGQGCPLCCAVLGQRGCPAAGRERCQRFQRALPWPRSHAAGDRRPRGCCARSAPRLCPHRRALRAAPTPSSLLPYGKNRALSSAWFILLLVEAAAALS